MPFSIKAFIKFRILFTRTFIMPSLEINHLLILSSFNLGRNNLPPIELTAGSFFWSDELAFTFSIVSYIQWDKDMDGFNDGRTTKDSQTSDVGRLIKLSS